MKAQTHDLERMIDETNDSMNLLREKLNILRRHRVRLASRLARVYGPGKYGKMMQRAVKRLGGED